MKTKLFFLVYLCISSVCFAQTTLIPDPNFEQALIDLGYDESPINGSVPTEYIDFISSLDLTDKNITNLTGIEDFNSLTSLECSGNQIMDLDLSNNNILSALNCAGNNLSYLNVKNGNNANFTNFKTFNNTNLTCIEVDNVAYSTANWGSGINSQMSFSEDCGTYVPDDNFEQALIDAGYDSGPLDDYVLTENIKNRTHLNVSEKNIADLTGIEDFTALTSLTCSQNQLTSLDLSHNKALTRLYCSSNMIRSLNIIQNKDLTHIRAHDNQLTSIDVSNNIDLIEFYCGINQLTSLDVSQNTALTSLVVYENQLSSLDVSFNTALSELACYNNQLTALDVKNGNNTNFVFFYATDNLNLSCIEVDDATYSTTNWTDIDPQASFSEDCSELSLTYVPDDNFEQALIRLGFDSGSLDDYVPTENINTVTTLDVSVKNITDLTGIEDFVGLKVLICAYNELTTLDLSKNAALTDLYAHNNLLTELDVSQNKLLTFFYVNINQLSSLNIKNDNNAIITEFVATDNPNLTCINVDDSAYSGTNWTSIDPQTSFSEDCSAIQLTYIPDDNFEQALINLGYDSGALDDYVPTANINTVTTLSVHNKNISDLTGIEGFVALEEFNCRNNLLTSIDLSNNSALTELTAHNNLLTTIDLTQNIALTSINIYSNQLISLDLSNNLPLTTLNTRNNNLESLDVTQNTALKSLNASNNLLPSIDLSNNIELLDLILSVNLLTTLDISQNLALMDLEVDNNLLTAIEFGQNIVLHRLIIDYNKLTNLDLSNQTALATLNANYNLLNTLDLSLNTNLIQLACGYNPLVSLNVKNGNNTNFTLFFAPFNINLTCIEVDDANYSTNNWSTIDEHTSFSETCTADPQTYIPDDNFEQALIDLGYDSGALDDYVPTNNINTVTTLDVSNKNIADLTGIEDFVVLEELYCNNNQITSINIENNSVLNILNISFNTISNLDVSNNLSLTSLNFSYNEIANVNLTNNTLLIDLYAAGNNLISLDLSDNPSLKKLYCPVNEISDLDVSINSDLTHLNVHFNNLISLNVKNNNNLNFIEFLATSNQNLTCIEVDDEAYSTNNWIGIDAQTRFSEDCSAIPLTYIPDDNFEQALIGLGLDSGPLDDYVPTENIEVITTLSISYKDISDLTGIEDFKALSVLQCYSNQLSSLNLTNNTNLTHVNIGGNNLLYLNVKNGANTNITTFITLENVNLLCIEVDDETFSTLHWSETIDSQTSFSESCQYLSTNNFEAIDFKIYPNPASNFINIESGNRIEKVSIYNLLGQDVLHRQETNHINISTLHSGTYFVKIKTNKGEQVKKIIKI
ncbi:T9SS type A sorting domain-containing protein [Algibacter sp. AS12]|uniref:T9SS type A sorting domain-containing protein n=1 Tax=Algibacter sp. AS12 TaxID=3135773 RepID=UPI00398A9D50